GREISVQACLSASEPARGRDNVQLVGRVAIVAAALLAAVPAVAQFTSSPERQAATEKDYRETLARLGIEHMRPGADGYNKQAPNYVNYDEAKAGVSS